MSRRIGEPLRPLTTEERTELERVQRAPSEALARHRRAQALLAVAEGATFTAAARLVGWRLGDTVSALVRRFNARGLAALDDCPRSGRRPTYTPTDRQRIVREFERTPDRAQDGTALWSLSTLQRALRTAADGLPSVSTFTILHTLHAAGFTCQKDRTWCRTGVARRKRKAGVVDVVDPYAEQKGG